ncbi:hypothetical protein AVEN_35888-1 [Araneus ventricosus]|uniref:Uncharacterized protein n=1 Tax=Araneus ventricosus TaxID=182803 RepID=A0A4Y2EG05_ARAVE|nr:hypothetical protein AVEN_35888-1 [Araneus ventricosus]
MIKSELLDVLTSPTKSVWKDLSNLESPLLEFVSLLRSKMAREPPTNPTASRWGWLGWKATLLTPQRQGKIFSGCEGPFRLNTHMQPLSRTRPRSSAEREKKLQS